MVKRWLTHFLTGGLCERLILLGSKTNGERIAG